VEVEATLQEAVCCGENGFTVEDVFWVVSASDTRFEKRLVACASMFDSNVDDRFIVDQTRVSRQDAVTHIRVTLHVQSNFGPSWRA
jgi:hypothetical protein